MQRAWPMLREVYRVPANFTSECGRFWSPGHNAMNTVTCESGICVTMVEPQYLGGWILAFHLVSRRYKNFIYK